jgi:hypothetical protein
VGCAVIREGGRTIFRSHAVARTDIHATVADLVVQFASKDDMLTVVATSHVSLFAETVAGICARMQAVVR